MSVCVFGEADGAPVLEISIASQAGASAKIITWGASVRDLVVPSRQGSQRVVLGLTTLADYQAYASHMGAIAGRFANRIAGGRFTIDGQAFQLPLNQAGIHSSHGGGRGFGFGVRPWELVSFDASSVTLALHSPDNDAGYPGAMDVTCTFTLVEPATLRVALHAVTSKPTVINLAHHSYFNLDGSPTILDHELTLPCTFRTPNAPDLIPTGEIVSVVSTPWDFRQPHKIGARGTLYDANYMIDAQPDAISGMAHCATVTSAKNGMTLDVFTSEPCVQFYDAAKLCPPVPGLGGVRYGAHSGFCLEPQVIPDSPNRRHFTNSVLRPGNAYVQQTEYRFG